MKPLLKQEREKCWSRKLGSVLRNIQICIRQHMESKVPWFGCLIDKLSADEEYIETTIEGYVRLLLTKTPKTFDQV